MEIYNVSSLVNTRGTNACNYEKKKERKKFSRVINFLSFSTNFSKLSKRVRKIIFKINNSSRSKDFPSLSKVVTLILEQSVHKSGGGKKY